MRSCFSKWLAPLLVALLLGVGLASPSGIRQSSAPGVYLFRPGPVVYYWMPGPQAAAPDWFRMP